MYSVLQMDVISQSTLFVVDLTFDFYFIYEANVYKELEQMMVSEAINDYKCNITRRTFNGFGQIFNSNSRTVTTAEP